MTREEAIRCLSVHSSTNGSGLCTDEQHYEAKQMAIKALEQEPKTQMVDKSNFDIEQYKMDLQCAYDCGRASVEPKTENYDANFLEFLFNVINPNEMEKYMAMYNSSNIPAEGSSK